MNGFDKTDVKLADFLSEDLIFLDLETDTKLDAFRTMVTSMASCHVIEEPETFLDEVIERETIQPTCIGRGIAVPHARSQCVERPVIAIGRTCRDIQFSQSQADNVNLIFLMGTPKDSPNPYLQILAQLCGLLRQNDFRSQLLSASSSREMLKLFTEFSTS